MAAGKVRKTFSRVRSPDWLSLVARTCLVVGGLSCSDGVCTLIGCTDGLTVVLRGDVPAGVTIVATAADGSQRTAQCESGPCRVAFEGFHPEEVSVRVTWSDGSVAVTVRPQYMVSQPNGPNCPPTCRSDRVLIEF